MTDEVVHIKFVHEDSDFDYEDSLLPKAFDLPPSNNIEEDLSLPPMSGEQYLRRAMAEARECPGVVIASIEKKEQKQQISQLPTVPDMTCKTDLLPGKDWQILAMADFSKLRLKMDRLREKLDDDPAFYLYSESLPGGKDEERWLKIVLSETTTMGPSTRLCLALPEEELWDVLGLFRDWLSDKDISLPLACRWLYCLLACMKLPILVPSVEFTLRHIARTLIDYRAQIDSLESEELPHINLLVCIITRYFNHPDLVDP